jgi:dUTP pyrophosphatase
MQIKMKLSPGSEAPTYSREGDAGLDLRALESGNIPVGQIKLVGTGLFLELPPGFEAQIRPRSGLALNHGITVLNAPGTIDSNYRGEVGVILINHGKYTYNYKKGEKIAQMVISRFETVNFAVVEDLSETVRGQKGFGSSGKA